VDRRTLAGASRRKPSSAGRRRPDAYASRKPLENVPPPPLEWSLSEAVDSNSVNAETQFFELGPGGQIVRNTLIALTLLGLAACQRPSPAPETPAPTPQQAAVSTAEPPPSDGYVGVPEISPNSASPSPASESAGSVQAPEQVNMDAADVENQLIKTEVLARIDLMPRLTPEEKDKLYVQVERARGMGKIVTIPFATGKVNVGSNEATALQEKLKLPQIQKFAEDPTVVFVVLGFADTMGDPQKNVAISLQRADNVVKALKEGAGVMNVIHAVGMGSSDLFDAKNLEKNRVVEVWAVLP
jgi:outer membrane protein OmpA-like peptidoglycan-associated protein